MADDNAIVIRVTSQNDTKAGFDAAKRDAADAGDAAGSIFGNAFGKRMAALTANAASLGLKNPEIVPRINRQLALAQARLLNGEIRRVLEDSGGGGGSNLIGRLFGSGLGGLIGGSGAGAGAGIPGIGGALGTIGPVGGAAAAVGLLGSGALGVIPALLSALAGLGSFAALAIPNITAITGGVSSTAAAAANLATAQQNLSAAQSAYQKDPTQANLDALKTAQAGLTTATNAQKAAWAALDPAQQKVVTGIQGLQSNFGTLSAKFEPFVNQLATMAIQIGTKLLPVLGQFASATAPAVVTLFGQLNKAAGSPQFKQFVDQMLRLVPGTLLAVGQGLGQIAGAFGNLLVATVKVNDQTKILTIALDGIAGSLNTVAFLATAASAALQGIGRFLSWLAGGGGGNTAALSGPYVGSLQGLNFSGLQNLIPGALPTLVPPGGGPGPGKIGQLSAATPVIQLTVTPGGSALDNMFYEWLKGGLRVRGGGGPNSVQIALGQSHH